MLTGIGLGSLHLLEPIPDPAQFAHGHRPIGAKQLLAPYLFTLGMIITFAGIISLRYKTSGKKRNCHK